MQIDLKPTKLKSFIILGILLCVIVLSFNFKHIKLTNDNTVICSELSLPNQKFLLDRAQILQQVENLFQQQDTAIRRVVLSGPGGAGKTTVARLYGKAQQFALVWEFNAERSNSLIDSCNDLAFALATTIEQKQQLVFIQNIQDSVTKAKAIMNFVKRLLRDLPNWLLIYDNVENFMEIKDYLPQDANSWGTGRVIITTRELNVANTSYMKGANELVLGELKPNETLELFCKILYNYEPDHLPSYEKEQITNLLKNFQAFPLDIATAAYYIKNNSITYDEYLHRLSQFSQDFADSEQTILKETTDYTKTRHGIISVVLKKIIEENLEFKWLLLLISLLDSQNIPKEMLEHFTDTVIVEQFIHSLRKYSLITEGLFGEKEENILTISIHRSTQAISLAFLAKEFNQQEDNPKLQRISNSLIAYLVKVIQMADIPRMKAFMCHGEVFLRNNIFLNDSVRAEISSKVGNICKLLGVYQEAFRLFQQSIDIYRKQGNKLREALVTADLGYTYCITAKYKKAIKVWV